MPREVRGKSTRLHVVCAVVRAQHVVALELQRPCAVLLIGILRGAAGGWRRGAYQVHESVVLSGFSVPHIRIGIRTP